MQCFQHPVPRKEHRFFGQSLPDQRRQLLFKPVLEPAHCTGTCEFTGLQAAHSIAYRQQCDRFLPEV